MRRWVSSWGLLLVSLCTVLGAVKATSEKTEAEPALGITISENQIAIANALADFLFSYKERNPNAKNFTKNKDVSEVELLAVPADNKKTIRVGVINDCLPFCSKREDEFVGFEVDFLKLLAKENDFLCDFEEVKITEIPQSLRKNIFDVVLCAGMKDDANKEAMEYSTGYLTTDLGAISLKKSKTSDVNKLVLAGKRIGVLKNSFLEHYIRSANIQGASIIAFDSFGKLLESVVIPKDETICVDFALVDQNTARDWIAKNPELVYDSLKIEQEFVMYFSKNGTWKWVVDDGIKNLLGTQKFAELIQRWALEKI